MADSLSSSKHKTSLLARFMSGAAWTAIGRLSGTVGLVLVLSAVTRRFSQDDAGIYVVYQSTALLGAIIAGFGITPIVIRLIHTATEQQAFISLRTGIRRALLINLIGGFVVSIALTILVFSLGAKLAHGHLKSHLAIVISWMFLSVLSQTTGEIFRGFGRFGWAALVGGQTGGMLLNPIVAATVFLLPIQTSFDFSIVLRIQILVMSAIFCCAIGRLFFLIQRLPTTEPQQTDFAAPTMRWLIVESWPIAVTQVLVLGVVPLNILILGSVGTPKTAALFSAAYQIMMLIAAPLQILNIALPPFITELFSSGRKRELESLLRFSATAAAVPALMALTVVVTWPEESLHILFGSEFRDAATALIILVASNTVFVICGSCGMTLQLTGYQRLTMWNSLITVSLYLVILPTMISHFALAGAAICAGGRIVAGNLICLLLVKRHIGIWGIATIWPPNAFRHIHVIRNLANVRSV